MIAWAQRLVCDPSDYVPRFEDLRDSYVYFRSLRRLLHRADSLRQPFFIENALAEMQPLFEHAGFGDTTLMRKVLLRLQKAGLGPDVTYTDRQIELDILRLKKYESYDEKIAKSYLKQGARSSRARCWQYRLEVAIDEALAKGWYPLFGTYTVDPKRLPTDCLTRDDLWRKTPAWDRFVKKIKTEVADACGYGRRPAHWPVGSHFFRYFAIVEHGASGAHPHVHVVWLCKNIPLTWKLDPNTNCPTQTEVDIPAASALWSHGIQRKTMALFIVGSWFTNNWKIPRKSDTEPGKVGSSAAIAGYIGKYLTKGETKKWKHRVKATKNLGIEKLQRNLQQVKSLTLLFSLATRPANYDVSMMLQQVSACPLSLLRQKSKQELLRRLFSMKNTRAARLLMDQWTRKPSEFFSLYIKSVKDGQKPWRLMPEQRYNFYTLMLEAVSATVHCKQRLKRALEWLCYNEEKRKSSASYVLLKETSRWVAL